MEHKTYRFQYTERWKGESGLTLHVDDVLFSAHSDYQHVQVLQTDAFGRLLTLDGLVMLTEFDEFVYHEMIAHPALTLQEAPERALVVGGGDGGTVREVLRHPTVQQVDLVEIDEMVIDVARRFFPGVAAALDDVRLSVHVADGIEFAAHADAGSYDLVIVDSTDPVGFAEGLFGEAFYQDCARILNGTGLLVTQSESPWDEAFREDIRNAYALLQRLFPTVHLYTAAIPTYPLGFWSFIMGSKRLHPLQDFDRERAIERLDTFAGELQYYNPDLHRGAFALPNFVQRFLVGA